MLGRKERSQLELFISGSLRQLIPDDHVLVRVERVLDLSWLRDEVADCYCLEDGRPGIDPEAAVRLMLAGLLSGIVHDRRLMREAQVNLAIRWFAGYALHEKLPDHSSLTRIRQRWGPERFKAVLSRTVKACIAARIATGEVVHLDATLIRANVSWDCATRSSPLSARPASCAAQQTKCGGLRRRRCVGKVIAAHAVVFLEVADDGFDGGTPCEFALDLRRGAALLAARVDLERVIGWRCSRDSWHR
jgi:transposase